VHIHALWEEIQHQAARIANNRGVPYLFTPHGMLDPWSLAQSRVKKQLYMLWRLNRDLNRAAAIHLTSDAERDHVQRIVARSKLFVEPLGVDLSEFESLPARGTFRQRYPQLAGRKLVTFLGRIHREKGLELLVPAIAQLRRARPELDVALVIVGPDSQGYRATVEKLIADEGDTLRDDRVLFTGMLQGADRVAALVDSDLFALPSFHENFGLSVIEALACRVPVVISDEVNIHQEIARARVGGVTSCAVEPLVIELERWLSDEALCAAASERARPFVWERYDWNKIAANWVGHYRSLSLAGRGLG
jgi:glycosyltransferase involved in cell wall biosynthesis